jgi:hypothetical protein
MAKATVETGLSADRVNVALHTAHGLAPFRRGVTVAIALSLPVWAGLIFCAVRLL